MFKPESESCTISCIANNIEQYCIVNRVISKVGSAYICRICRIFKCSILHIDFQGCILFYTLCISFYVYMQQYAR